MATVRKRAVDTKFFYDNMKAKGLSLRETAKKVGTDHANLSLILRGVEGRYASLELVCDLSRLFGVPVEDIMRRFGHDVPRESTARVRVVGVADSTGRVDHSNGEEETVDRPRDASNEMIAVKVLAQGEPVDGWALYFVPAHVVEPLAVGRLAFVRDKEGTDYVGVLARERGKWSVRPFGREGKPPNSGLTVNSAAPIEWIRTEP